VLEAVNSRHLKDSRSLHLEEEEEEGERYYGEDELFGAFSSVTLHYDGD